MSKCCMKGNLTLCLVCAEAMQEGGQVLTWPWSLSSG